MFKYSAILIHVLQKGKRFCILIQNLFPFCSSIKILLFPKNDNLSKIVQVKPVRARTLPGAAASRYQAPRTPRCSTTAIIQTRSNTLLTLPVRLIQGKTCRPRRVRPMFADPTLIFDGYHTPARRTSTWARRSRPSATRTRISSAPDDRRTISTGVRDLNHLSRFDGCISELGHSRPSPHLRTISAQSKWSTGGENLAHSTPSHFLSPTMRGGLQRTLRLKKAHTARPYIGRLRSPCPPPAEQLGR